MLNFVHFVSLRAKNLRLLRPKGLAMTQKRRFALVNNYKNFNLLLSSKGILYRKPETTPKQKTF